MMQYYLTVIFIALWVTKLYKRRQKASFQQIWHLAFLVLHLLIDTWQLACASFLELLSCQRD